MFDVCPKCNVEKAPLYFCNEHQLSQCCKCQAWVPWSLILDNLNNVCETCHIEAPHEQNVPRDL